MIITTLKRLTISDQTGKKTRVLPGDSVIFKHKDGCINIIRQTRDGASLKLFINNQSSSAPADFCLIDPSLIDEGKIDAVKILNIFNLLVAQIKKEYGLESANVTPGLSNGIFTHTFAAPGEESE